MARPEGLEKMPPRPLDIVDSPDLPPLWQAFGALRRSDGHWAMPELRGNLASPDVALHIGPQHVLLETAAIEAGANEVEPLTHEQEDGIPKGAAGAKFICGRTDTGTVTKWLSTNGWTVITSEIGFVPKVHPELTEEQRQEVGEFLQALEENDDVHRVWAAVK